MVAGYNAGDMDEGHVSFDELYEVDCQRRWRACWESRHESGQTTCRRRPKIQALPAQASRVQRLDRLEALSRQPVSSAPPASEELNVARACSGQTKAGPARIRMNEGG